MRKMFTFKVESSCGNKIVAIWKCVCQNAIENCSFRGILVFTSNLTCQSKLLVMQNCSILVHASLFHFFIGLVLDSNTTSSCYCDLLKMVEGYNSLVVDVVQWRLWNSHPLLLELYIFVVACLKSIRSFTNVICMKQCSLQLCKMELCNWKKLAIKIEIFALFWKPYVTPLPDPKMFIFRRFECCLIL